MFHKLTKKPGEIVYLAPEKIRRGNTIRRQSDDELHTLIKSISEYGILQPIGVCPVGDEYRLVFGERRLAAAKACRLSTVPCIICKGEASLVAMHENICRRGLSLFEQADGINIVINECELTHAETAQKLGVPLHDVDAALRLLTFSRAQRELMIGAGLGARQINSLLRIEDEGMRREALDVMIARSMNEREAEEYVDRLLNPKPEATRKMVIGDVRIFANSIEKAVGIMRGSGVPARSHRAEDEDFIRYTITIPKM